MKKPLCIDLFCGLGGWSEGFLAEGWDCIGFDTERHDYGTGGYPGQLVLQDVLTLHGSQFKTADCIVCSPPCQEYSYMAMPWSRAKAIAADYRSGALDTKNLNALFDACFRIQREAIEAQNCTCGHPDSDHDHDYLNKMDDDCRQCSCIRIVKRRIPLVVENVKGAQPWVGQAGWHFGSYYLWGDLPALMPITYQLKRPGRNFHAFENGLGSSPAFNGGEHETRGVKTVGHVNKRNKRNGHSHTRHLTNQAESDAIKNNGGSWFNIGLPGQKETGRNPVHEGIKQGGISGPRTNGKGDRWFQDGAAKNGSKSKARKARKAASAAIAKIPFVLAQHIARAWKPQGDFQ